MSVDRGAEKDLWRLGRRLQWATIAWNGAEVFIAVGLGLAARSLALIAFGLDSLIEVFASVVAIWHIGSHGPGRGRGPDRRALRLVGVAFAALTVYLVATSLGTLARGTRPDSSPLGIAYLGLTAAVMFWLARLKRRVGTALESEPLRAEASMTFLDGCLASGILAALALNLLLGWWWADALAALLVGGAAGREAFGSWKEARASSESAMTRKEIDSGGLSD